MKTTKAQQSLINSANGVIHRQNLFRDTNNRRVIHAHMHDGTPCVQDLYTGELYSIAENTWRNGAGHVVTL